MYGRHASSRRELGLGVHSTLIRLPAEILSAQEAEPGGSRVGGQPGMSLKTLLYQSKQELER